MKIKSFGVLMMYTFLIGISSFNEVYAQISAPTGTGLPDVADPNTVIANIVKLIMGMIGAIAVLIIVIAGIMYMTSGGDQGRTETAKNWIVYAIVGLIVSILSYMIVSLTVGVF